MHPLLYKLCQASFQAKKWKKSDLLSSLNLNESQFEACLDLAQAVAFPLHQQGSFFVFSEICQPLNAERLQKILQPICPHGVHIASHLPSTSQYLKDNLSSLCLTEWQSAGYGRGKKSWQAPFATNLLLSVQWLTAQACPPLLSLHLSLQLQQQLQQLFAKQRFQVKWPNDILLNGKKVAGMILESYPTNQGYRNILGIGINVNQQHMPIPIKKTWTSIALAENQIMDRTQLAIDCIQSLHQAFLQSKQPDFCLDIHDYNQQHSLHQQWIQADHGANERIQGQVMGVSAVGALILREDDNSPQHYSQLSNIIGLDKT